MDATPERAQTDYTLPPEFVLLDSMDFSDIAEQLHFNPVEGRIWLQDRRMALLPVEVLGAMRREMIDSLGLEGTRRLITRLGYTAGSRDAELAWKVRGHQSQLDIIAAGAQFHALEGFVKAEPVHIEIDNHRGYCYSEFLWNDNCEDEIQIANYGVGHEGACWMGIGYTSGFLSKIMGKRILAREVECRAMGQAKCRVIAQPVENWDDPEEDLHYLQVAPPPSRVMVGAAGVKENNTPLANAASTAAEPQSASPILVGSSVSFTAMLHKVHRVATTRATVLLSGESGVGKSAVAREVHGWSNRADKPFVEVNCAAIPEQLLESELFGVERGAFSGATESRAGRFEAANGGTLFLDEIGILSFSAQGKLLRVLQSGEFERLGSTRTIKLDVRVVAATNEDLPKAVKEGRFREDLFYRINVFPIHIPPLRERRDDLPLLIEYFTKRLSALHGRHVPGIMPRALQAVLNHKWPGNIREFENVIERGIILADDGESLDLRHLFSVDSNFAHSSLMRLTESGMLAKSDALANAAEGTQACAASSPATLEDWARGAVRQQGAHLADVEDALVNAAMSAANGNVSKAAALLGLTRAQLDYRVKRNGNGSNGRGHAMHTD
ncbi:sigma 54-interacting transcriptional regulator [Paraburkholderia sp. CNPSo 3272]|uniref:sigma-54-dependent Fis family transcriptional regulator n=1 Tax=Paraburkholderia sp. CNPSo 3272 TaxID=2940931 RepID=UPI0020B81380|nr:sigma-54-dependent Fis family transcriptional regulator [Paraburkholderia sp. CNPSo 3272]MCP3728331.1 sigma 54-interacting transcriptional regulator [Paraburkholderia sp. CNPSo 3272]